MSALIAGLEADFPNLDSGLLPVQLTRAEHLVVIGALNRIQAMATGEGLFALESLVRAFEENVEDWAALRRMNRGKEL